MDSFDAFVVEEVGRVFIWGELCFGSVDDGDGFQRRKLAFFWYWMVVFEEDGGNVFLHGESTGALGVVPFEVDACVEIALQVFGEFIVFLMTSHR